MPETKPDAIDLDSKALTEAQQAVANFCNNARNLR